jgi:rod shape-determining protein MreD
MYSAYRLIAHALCLTVLFILQQTPNLLPKLLGRTPNLVLAAFPIIILLETPKTSAWFGFFIGLILDSCLGESVGIQPVILCVLGYWLSSISSRYFRKNFLAAIVVSTTFLLLFYHLQFLCLYILKGYEDAEYSYLKHQSITMLYTWVFVPIFYFFNKIFISKIRDSDD